MAIAQEITVLPRLPVNDNIVQPIVRTTEKLIPALNNENSIIQEKEVLKSSLSLAKNPVILIVLLGLIFLAVKD